MTEPETLTAEERGWAQTSAGYERKLLRLYDQERLDRIALVAQALHYKQGRDAALARAEAAEQAKAESDGEWQTFTSTIRKGKEWQARVRLLERNLEWAKARCQLDGFVTLSELERILREGEPAGFKTAAESALAEATALLERCLPLAPPGSELRSFIRDWLRGLSRTPAPAAKAEPTAQEQYESAVAEAKRLLGDYEHPDTIALRKYRAMLTLANESTQREAALVVSARAERDTCDCKWLRDRGAELCSEPTAPEPAAETDENGDPIPTMYKDCGKCRYPSAGVCCGDEWCIRRRCCGHEHGDT